MYFLQASLFGSKHLIGLLFIALFFIVFNYILKKLKLTNKQKMIFFTIFFYLLEIAKLGYIIYIDGSFPIYQLPFHLCSLPLYLYPVILLIKNKTLVEKYLLPASFAIVLVAGIMALALPTNILGSQENWLPLKDNILPLISFFYHGLMIFSSIYLLKNKIYQFEIKDYPKAMTVGITFAAIAHSFNILLDKDFMLLNKATGSPLAFIFDISKPLYQLSMISSFAILIAIVFIITNLINSKFWVRKIIKTT